MNKLTGNYWLKHWPGIWHWNFEMTRCWARGKYGEVKWQAEGGR